MTRLNLGLCVAALSYAGIRELSGKSRNNSKILQFLRTVLRRPKLDETPWCSAFVKAVGKECGADVDLATAAARSWRHVGGAMWLSSAEPGDVVVLSRPGSSWSGHVGFYCRHDKNWIWILGGNQGNSVSIKAYPRRRLLAVRRLREADDNA
jgi:uncharacterized protein (TIGR02594 family)